MSPAGAFLVLISESFALCCFMLVWLSELFAQRLEQSWLDNLRYISLHSSSWWSSWATQTACNSTVAQQLVKYNYSKAHYWPFVRGQLSLFLFSHFTFSGFLKDYLGHYSYIFYITGAAIAFASVITIAAHAAPRSDSPRSLRKEDKHDNEIQTKTQIV